MRFLPTDLPGVTLIEPDVYKDERGFFLETWHERKYAEAGIRGPFVQDNHSHSARGTQRGLHAQLRRPQGKLVRAVAGEMFDVAVDIRRGSPTFAKWVGFTLSAKDKRIAWIPPGFAHGFLVTSDAVEFLYKTTDYWYPEFERSLLWNDPDLAIDWPLNGCEPKLAAKDPTGTR